MGFRCYNCKELFDYPKRVPESRGEFWGMPAYEDMYYCPRCGSDDWDEEEVIRKREIEEEEEE